MLIKKPMIKIKNSILAIEVAITAIPPKPNTPATIASAKNIKAANNTITTSENVIINELY